MTKKKNEPRDWVWMPHPGHFICGNDCKFFLNTYLGNGYLVSTVGELFPDSRVRQIFAETRGIEVNGKGDDYDRDYLNKIGYEDIGFGRKYETMVFKAQKYKNTPNTCCPYRQISGQEVDMIGYNDAKEAWKGHMSLCKKWGKR